MTNLEYSVDSPVDKKNDYFSKNSNYNLMTSLLKTTAATLTDNGLICDFDVTDSIMSSPSENTLKIYMYIANKGTGAKFLYCSTPPVYSGSGVAPIISSNYCQFIENFPSTNEIPGIIVTEGGFDLNVITIKKGSLTNTVSIKVNAGDEVINTTI